MASDWTFLTKHAAALLALSWSPDSTLEEIAEAAGISHRWAVKVVNDLLEEGYVRRDRTGRSFRYSVDAAKPLRLGIVRHVPVAQLTALLELPADASDPVERRAVLGEELRNLRYEVERERELLGRLRADRNRLAAAVARAQSALSLDDGDPATPPS